VLEIINNNLYYVNDKRKLVLYDITYRTILKNIEKKIYVSEVLFFPMDNTQLKIFNQFNIDFPEKLKEFEKNFPEELI